MSFAVFLDVDGVLNSHKTCVGTPEGHFGVTDFRVNILSQAIRSHELSGETVKIVLTSDWKLIPEAAEDYQYLISVLEKYGLKISGKTEDESYYFRGDGINRYLVTHHDIDDFVILDDNTFDFADHTKL